MTLDGSGFRGISGGFGGNFSQDSAADYPIVQLRSMESDQTLLLSSANWSSNSFTSTPVVAFTPGWTLATVFVNGIPSTATIINIIGPLGSSLMIVSINVSVDGYLSLI